MYSRIKTVKEGNTRKEKEMKKQVMTRAWEIARAAQVLFGGKVREFFAEALRMAWKEIKGAGKKIIDRIAELEAKGFKRWQKGTMDRLYINARELGLVCTYYKSGNIQSATFNGEKISNSEAYRIKNAKTYIDVATEELVSNHLMCKAAAEALMA